MKELKCTFQSQLLLLFLCIACTKSKNSIEYTEPLIQSKIISYIQTGKSPYSKRKVLTVILTGKNDTVDMEIANTYPDLTEANIIAHDRIDGYDVFFIGEQRDDFYKIGQETPMLARKKLHEIIYSRYRNRPIPGINYRLATFRFINHKLVQ